MSWPLLKVVGLPFASSLMLVCLGWEGNNGCQGRGDVGTVLGEGEMKG